jgi:hypothetical protein
VAAGGEFFLRAKACSKALRIMTGVVHPPQCYGGRATEDGSAVRIVRPNGANTKLRTCANRCRATYSGSPFLGKSYTSVAGKGAGMGRDLGGGLCCVVRLGPLSAGQHKPGSVPSLDRVKNRSAAK